MTLQTKTRPDSSRPDGQTENLRMNRSPQRNHASSAPASTEYDGHTYNIPARAAIGTVWPCACCPENRKTKVTLGIDGEILPYCELPSDFGFLVDDGDESGVALQGILQLARGESRSFRFVAADANALLSLLPLRRVAQHWWYGHASIVCPEHTAQELLPPEERGRKCPLCALGDDLPEKAKLAVQWHLPVLEQAREKNGQARTIAVGVRLLRLNPRTYTGLRNAVLSFDKQEINPCTVVWRIERQDDKYGSYGLIPTDKACEPVSDEYVLPPLQVRLENDYELQKFADTLRMGGQIEPKSGRAEQWRKVFKGAALIACTWGRKKPLVSGYMDDERAHKWQDDEYYLGRLDESSIATKLEPPYAAIDLDRDEDVDDFVALNPWARSAMRVIGGRGCKFPVRIKGEYPLRVLNVVDPREPDVTKQHRGEFRGSGLAIVDGLHPSGKLYRVEKSGAGNLPEIEYSAIVWPEGWTVQKVLERREFEFGDGDPVEGGLLDLAKLKHVHEHPTKDGVKLAQCPVCAAADSDKTGNHLIIYADGRYGCAAHQDDAEHRSEIFALAGRDDLNAKREARNQERKTVAELAALDPLGFARKRKEIANEWGVKESDVEKAVAAHRKAQQNGVADGQGLSFKNVEPWPQPVNLDETLMNVSANLNNYLVTVAEALVVIPLWVTHTYCFNSFDYSPILHLKSPEKRCGKSKALDFLRRLVSRPLKTANASGAALFRAIEKWKPSCLIDEYDSACRQGTDHAEALRNVLNAGFERGNPCLRCSGDDFEPRVFDVYGPKAVACIGALPDTAADRSIVIPMRRKLKTEKVKRLREFDATELQRKLARWVQDNAEALRQARPHIPPELDDRAADIWEPLFCIADAAGGDWPRWAREAAVTLSAHREGGETFTERLLQDIRTVFDQEQAERLETDKLLFALEQKVESPWPTFCRGKPLNAHRLGRMLAEFGIEHRRWKSAGSGSPYGFYRTDFEDAWTRYLAPEKDSNWNHGTAQ